MAISIGPVDFTGIADLPDIARKARIQSAEEALGSVDFNNPDAVSKRAGQLIAIGDMEGALKLQQTALAQREINRKIAYDRQYLESLPAFLAAMKGGTAGGAPGAPGAPETPFNIYAPPASAAPSGPSPFDRPPGALPPQGFPQRSDLPPQLGRPGSGIASLESNIPQEPTPSERIILAAQGALPAQPAGPQYAQAGGPQMSVTTAPSGRPRIEALPPWLQTGAAVPTDAGAAPATPSAPQPILGLGPEAAAQDQFRRIMTAAGAVGPRAPGQLAGLRAAASEALQRAKISPERFDWAMEQFDNAALGNDPNTGQPIRPPISFSAWQDNKAGRGRMLESAMKVYDTTTEAARAAQPTVSAIQSMRALLENPNLIQGPGTGNIRQGLGYVRSLRDSLTAAGIPIPDSVNKLVDSATSSVEVAQAFDSLQKSFTLSRLGGSLKQGISEGDRVFMSTTGPNLENVRGGNQILLDFYEGVAKQQIGMGKEANRLQKEQQGRLSPSDLNNALEKYAEEHPVAFNADGTPATALGRKMLELQKQPSIYQETTQGAGPVLAQQAKDAASAAASAIAPPLSAAGQAVQSGVQRAVNAVPAAISGAASAIGGSFAPDQAPFTEPGSRPAAPLPSTAVGRAASTIVNAAGAGLNRLATSPTALPQPQASLIQSLGQSPSGEFDATSFTGRYNDLSPKDKAMTFGGAKPGSMRESLDNITKGDTLERLGRVVPGNVIGQALINPAQTASVAAWARALDIVRRTNGARPAIARFKIATDNLKNNIGGDFTYNDFLGGGQ